MLNSWWALTLIRILPELEMGKTLEFLSSTHINIEEKKIFLRTRTVSMLMADAGIRPISARLPDIMIVDNNYICSL